MSLQQWVNNNWLKRNIVEYDYTGGATSTDADELIAFVKEFKIEVLSWLKKNHSDLME